MAKKGLGCCYDRDREDLRDHGDNPESYDDMPAEALHMAHCCDAFLNGFQAFVLDVFVAEMRTL